MCSIVFTGLKDHLGEHFLLCAGNYWLHPQKSSSFLGRCEKIGQGGHNSSVRLIALFLFLFCPFILRALPRLSSSGYLCRSEDHLLYSIRQGSRTVVSTELIGVVKNVKFQCISVICQPIQKALNLVRLSGSPSVKHPSVCDGSRRSSMSFTI